VGVGVGVGFGVGFGVEVEVEVEVEVGVAVAVAAGGEEQATSPRVTMARLIAPTRRYIGISMVPML
jgi:hypothetical protein